MPTAVNEFRLTPREILSEPVLIRPCDPRFPEEICMTANVSLTGLYFVTTTKHYYVGMNVIVVLNFAPHEPFYREHVGDVVRIDETDGGKSGIAIRILMHGNPGIYSGT